MEFRILGPLEVCGEHGPLPLERVKPRAVLVVLLLHANEAVSAERLALALWGEEARAGATKTVQVHISRLRKALGDPLIISTTPAGYRLRVRPGELDVEQFERLVTEGRLTLAEGRAEHAAGVLREALDLWRGPPLADLSFEPFAQAEIARLEERRLAALETRVEADLATGRHDALVGELQQLAVANPTRERLAGQLMLALYRGGRQAEALAAYQHVRRHLSAELGLEPGPALQALQAGILEQSKSLEHTSTDVHPPSTRRDASSDPARLPVRLAGLLGRDEDTRAVISLLLRDDVRLVTLIGVGGVGKTSLAVEVAHRLSGELADGAAFVDLAPVSDPAQVGDVTLRTLGGTPEPDANIGDALCRLIAGREQLLVFDNFEHLLDGASLIGDLIDAAPRATFLVTSRAALDLRDEHRYRVDPLALPASGELVAVATAPATALFIARSAARDPSFQPTADAGEAIATICASVDGIPLAIELAAARTSTLAPHEIAHRLDRVLTALGAGGRDAPDRQRTLRATLDWSYNLLDERERTAFAHLAAFAGGCTIDAAGAVTGTSLDVIDNLIAQSMLTRRAASNADTRLGMLEPVREYAAESLAARPDHEEVVERHCRYYLKLARDAGSEKALGRDRPTWLRRLDADAENIRRAVERERRAGNLELVLSAATALEFWFHARALWSEGRRWIEGALEAAGDDLPVRLHAEGLRVLASLCSAQIDLEQSLACGQRALKLYRTLDAPDGLALCLAELSGTQLDLGDVDAAQSTAAEAVRVARQAHDQVLATALSARAVVTPDLSAAQDMAAEAAVLLEQVGDVTELARLWGNLGFNALELGATAEADQMLERSLELCHRIGDLVSATHVLSSYALVALETGDHAVAASRFHETLRHCQTHGLRRPVAESLTGLAAISAMAGDPRDAARLTGAATGLRFGQAPSAMERRLQDRLLSAARQQLGENGWDHELGAGQRLDLESAIRLGIDTASRYTELPAPVLEVSH